MNYRGPAKLHELARFAEKKDPKQSVDHRAAKRMLRVQAMLLNARSQPRVTVTQFLKVLHGIAAMLLVLAERLFDPVIPKNL